MKNPVPATKPKNLYLHQGLTGLIIFLKTENTIKDKITKDSIIKNLRNS